MAVKDVSDILVFGAPYTNAYKFDIPVAYGCSVLFGVYESQTVARVPLMTISLAEMDMLKTVRVRMRSCFVSTDAVFCPSGTEIE